MTNLERWLMYIALLCVPYFAIVYGTVKTPVISRWMFEIQILPIILIILFGIYAAGTVLYRTLTFNDCPEAAKELQEHIKAARENLTSKGFKFRD